MRPASVAVVLTAALLAPVTAQVPGPRRPAFDVASVRLNTDPSSPVALVPALEIALEEQLGLRLRADREAVTVVVIDGIERPDPN